MSQTQIKLIAADLIDLLKQSAVEAGQELVADLDSVADYISARMIHLSSIVAEPGFNEAVEAERDAIALKAAGRAIDRADAFDGRIVAIIQGTIMAGARALAVVI